MAYFVVYGLDAPGSAEVRTAHRAAHRERLRAPDHPVTVHVGGPLLDEVGDMIGSLLIIEADSMATVEAFVAGDPYSKNDLYASVEIRPFNWGLGAPESG